jgi:hypothetical protein
MNSFLVLTSRTLAVEEVSEKTTVMISDKLISWLTDKNLDNCDWINQSDILSIQLPETFSPVNLTLLTEANHKSSRTVNMIIIYIITTLIDVDYSIVRIFDVFSMVSSNF